MNEPQAETRAGIISPDAWVDQHGNYLFQYAMFRVRDRGVAEDLVQETFLAALHAQERYEGRASERTWLIGILKHKVIDHLRKAGREQPTEDIESHEDSLEDLFDERGKWKRQPTNWASDPRSELEKKEFWQFLMACLAELPDRMARVFNLRELDGLETTEIGNLLGITATNIGVSLHRARMRLRRCLEVKWGGGGSS
jgi:RNA polymerase sigma-70 factor (ECF subfamily)